MTENNRPVPAKMQKPLLVVSVMLILGLLFFANLQTAKLYGPGIDFLIRWMPTRLLLMGEVDSPYAIEASEATQTYLYGRLAAERELPCLFLYPYYFIFFLLPFGLVSNFPIAVSLWMTLLELLMIAMVILSMKMLNYSPRPVTVLLFLLCLLPSPRFLQPILDGNPAILSAFFVLLTLYFIQKKLDVFAGVALALSTIKPQLVLLFFLLICLWAFSTKRWKIIVSAVTSVVLLMGVSFLFQPSWFREFFHHISIYQEYARPNTPSMILSGEVFNTLQLVINVVVVGALGFTWWKCWGKSVKTLLWTAMISFCLLPLTSLPFGNRNLVVLIPAFIIIFYTISYQREKTWVYNLLLLFIFLYSWIIVILPSLIPGIGPLFLLPNYLAFVILMTVGMVAIRKKWNRIWVDSEKSNASK